MKLSDLKNDALGSTVAVCGGGPSLPADLERVLEHDTGPVEVLAVKQHALYLQREIGFGVDMICFLEDPDAPGQLELRTALRLSPDVLKVSPFAKWSDAELDVPWWQDGASWTLALWLAGWMGPERILLCGMDCYQGEKKYFYERPGYFHPIFHSTLDGHLEAWRKAFDHVPNADRIRAVSGPLAAVFGGWRP